MQNRIYTKRVHLQLVASRVFPFRIFTRFVLDFDYTKRVHYFQPAASRPLPWASGGPSSVRWLLPRSWSGGFLENRSKDEL